MHDEIIVASNLYFILPVYVTFSTWNKPVNQRPIFVNGIKHPMHIARTKATAKLTPNDNQFQLLKSIVNTPSNKLELLVIVEVKHKKKHTGMLQIML